MAELQVLILPAIPACPGQHNRNLERITGQKVTNRSKDTSKAKSDLIAHVESTIGAKRLLAPGARLLVAVSGGLDSMVLLHLIHRLAGKHRWSLAVAHFNHQLRGMSSLADERLVRHTAARLGLRFRCGRAQVRRAAARDAVSLEVAGRQLRHAFLARTARVLKTGKVALAHHADDQIELFFLRLLRGAGSDGLTGMRFQSDSPADPRVQLIRPLLDLSRAELESFAREEGIDFRHDASNADLDFMRNRLRHKLLPLLRNTYQPALNQVLRRTLDVLEAEADLVTQLAKDAIGECTAFQDMHLAIQRRWLRNQCYNLGLEPEFQLIEQLRTVPGRKITVQRGCTVWRDETGQVHRERGRARQRQPATKWIPLSPGSGEIALPAIRFTWRIRRWTGRLDGLKPSRPGCEKFDADKMGARIRLRHWRPGDRFQPIGMGTAVKLQDLFTNRKIPRARRSELCIGEAENGEIFWVEDLRIGEKFKVGAQTHRYLDWRWHRFNVE